MLEIFSDLFFRRYDNLVFTKTGLQGNMISIIILLFILKISRTMINQIKIGLIIKRSIDLHINLNYALIILFIKILKFISHNSFDQII